MIYFLYETLTLSKILDFKKVKLKYHFKADTERFAKFQAMNTVDCYFFLLLLTLDSKVGDAYSDFMAEAISITNLGKWLAKVLFEKRFVGYWNRKALLFKQNSYKLFMEMNPVPTVRR